MTDNAVGWEGATQLSEALKENKTLERLGLGGEEILSDDICQLWKDTD